MKKFALGFFVGLAISAGVSGYLWRARSRGGRVPPPPHQPVVASPQPGGPTSTDLEAANKRIEDLCREIEQLKSAAGTNQAPQGGKKTWEELAPRLVAVLKDFELNSPETRKLASEVYILLKDVESDTRLSNEETAISPLGFPRFLAVTTSLWNPPLSAEQRVNLSELLESYDSEWSNYLTERDLIMGVERISRLDELQASFAERFDKILNRSQQDLYDSYDSFWNMVSFGTGVHEQHWPICTRDALRTKLIADWSLVLVLRPDQTEKVGGLVDEYVRDVEQAKSAKAGVAPQGEPDRIAERDCMIAIQRRMPATLGLDMPQIERLKDWRQVDVFRLSK